MYMLSSLLEREIRARGPPTLRRQNLHLVFPTLSDPNIALCEDWGPLNPSGFLLTNKDDKDIRKFLSRLISDVAFVRNNLLSSLPQQIQLIQMLILRFQNSNLMYLLTGRQGNFSPTLGELMYHHSAKNTANRNAKISIILSIYLAARQATKPIFVFQ